MMPPAEAVAAIRSFLASHADRSTGMEFSIASKGSLDSWPSLRTFLLDQVLAIDPDAAAALGREILASPTSADEWAIALRNVARGERAGESTAAYLRVKTEELIRNPAWQSEPSAGYLNAFDVLVFAGATQSTPLLSSLIQMKDRKDLAHASFLTLDRLVQQFPADLLGRLAADHALHASRPEMTGQQFARADLRDPAQRGIVKAWLLDPARSAAELRAFSGVFPNNNRFVSNNLLTEDQAIRGEDLATHDREVLAILSAWSSDPELSPVRDHLATITTRLRHFTKTPPAAAAR